MQTSSTTITQTNTIDPTDASTTVTGSASTTTTVTTVSSSTSTSVLLTTVTVVAPQATYYAACDTDNMVTEINGQNIVNGFPYNYALFSSGTASSAQDCCIQCVTSGSCAASVFGPVGYGNDCAFFGDGGTCNGAVVVGTLTTDPTYGTGGAAGYAYSASNGDCGQLTFDASL